MANHASHAALPYPIKNARFSVLIPSLDADGDPTAAATPDTEVSLDNAAAADAAEEVSATSGMDGMALITFTGAETNCSTLGVNFKVASGPKATLATIYPRALAAITSAATLSAGSSSGGTLTTPLAYDITGCFLRTAGGTGGGGTGGANNQARRIATYTPSTGVFTVTPNFETAIDNTTTVDVLLPEGVTLGMLRTLNPTTAGRTLDVASTGEAGIDLANIAAPSAASAKYLGARWRDAGIAIADDLTVTLSSGHGLGRVGVTLWLALDGGTNADGKGRWITWSTGDIFTVDPAWNSGGETRPSGSLTGTVYQAFATPVAAVPLVELTSTSRGAVADDVWDEATSGHTTSGTFGEQLKTDVDAILADTDVIGATGAGLTSLATAAELAKVPKSDSNVTWNATAAAQLQTEATDALNAYDPPTHAELTSGLAAADDAVLSAIAALNNLSNAQLVSAIAAGDDAVLAAIAALNNLAAGAAMTLTSAERNAIADALLGRNIAGGSSTGRTVTSAIRKLRNRVAISGGTMTVYQEDDSTADHTEAVTTTAGNPISETDPAT